MNVSLRFGIPQKLGYGANIDAVTQNQLSLSYDGPFLNFVYLYVRRAAEKSGFSVDSTGGAEFRDDSELDHLIGQMDAALMDIKDSKDVTIPLAGGSKVLEIHCVRNQLNEIRAVALEARKNAWALVFIGD